MTNLEFQSTLYRTKADMLDSIAYEWFTAGGLNNPEQIDDMLPIEPVDAANEAIYGWGLDTSSGHGDSSHMAMNEYTADDLANAMRDFIINRPDKH